MDPTSAGHAATPDWPGIVKQYAPLVWRTVYRLLGRQVDAEDCFQETFLAAMKLVRREPVTHWAGLLQRIATARALDRLRQRRSEMNRRLAFDESGSLASSADPAHHAENAELAGALRHALTQLPALQSEAYCLRHLNDLSYQEIAGQLEISVDHVGVLLHRSRARLRELLAHVGHNPMKTR